MMKKVAPSKEKFRRTKFILCVEINELSAEHHDPTIQIKSKFSYHLDNERN